MKTLLHLFIISVTLSLTLIGCSKKQDVDTEVRQVIIEIEKAAPAPAGPTPPPSAMTPNQTAPAPNAPASKLSEALAAYKSGEYEKAIAQLDRLRNAPAMTGQQLIAMNKAMAAVMNDLYTLAEKGDARAAQAIKHYNETRNNY